MESDHGSVVAQFVIPAPKKKDSQHGFKKNGGITQQRRASKVRRSKK